MQITNTPDTTAPGSDRRRKSRPLAAFLSFLWPGLGQLYAGRRRQSAIFGVPALVVLLVVLYQARQGLAVFVARFVDPGFAMAALLIILAAGALRIASVAHAYVTVERGPLSGGPLSVAPRTGGPLSGGPRRWGRLRGNERAIPGVLIAIIVATHGLAGAVAYLDYASTSQIFSPPGPGDLGPLSSDTPPPDIFAGGSEPPASFGPIETPRAIPGRVTILFTGVDSYPTRGERLYDSIQVVSLDTVNNKVAIMSVPRDSAAYPLYFGGAVGPTTRINALVTYVQHGWIKSPDDAMTTFVKEIGFLVGLPIDYYAVIDLAGFVKLIDMVGGIDINNPSAIVDPSYDWLDGVHRGYSLSAGPHHLDGKNALAYVRSRHGSGNNDYRRASRQQQVMVALEHKMASPDMIIKLPTVMQTLGSSIRTTFPAGQVADMVALGNQIPSQNIYQVVLGPPYSDTGTGAAYHVSTSCLRLDKIAALSVQLFGDGSRYFGKNQADTCP